MGAYIDAAGQTVVGWTKPAGYDSWQTEWLRARGQWHWWSQPGKWNLSRSPLTEEEVAATAASTTCGIIGSSIVSAAPTQAGVGSLSACAAASPAGLVVAFVFFDAACWTSAAGFGVAVGEVVFSDATLGDAIYAGGGLVGSALGVR